MKTPQKKKAHQAEDYIVCYYNGLRRPKEFYRVKQWWKTYKSSLTSGFTDPIGKEKILSHFSLQKIIEENPPGTSERFIRML